MDYRLPFPRVVRIEPSSKCNLKCSHCPTGIIDMERGVMKDEVFSSVLSTIKANQEFIKVVVLYHGGEPFMSKRLFHMVRELKTCGTISVKTVSNGMILTELLIAGLVDSGMDIIEFSLDGISPEQNNFVRRGCNYEKVVENIKKLILYKKRASAIKPQIFISTTQFVDRYLPKETMEARVPAFLLEEFSGEYEVAGFKPTLAMRWPHVDIIENTYDVYIDPNDTEVRNYCDHVYSTVTVRSNGDVVPCCYDLTSEYVMGNVLKSDLASIWNNEKSLYIRKSIDQKKFISLCNNCNVVKPNAYLLLKPDVLKKFSN
ncbi:MAG: hypothetical protein A2W23_03220 [Planctomycetes bacterium RBG_16_43_13]|nr:MAG: hypothetical protein A2W23_03220 [Planctomycetes bacterium RBG_16_43_13]